MWANVLVGCPGEGIDLLQPISGRQDGLEVLQLHCGCTQDPEGVSAYACIHKISSVSISYCVNSTNKK
jgi:hypothetical protein